MIAFKTGMDKIPDTCGACCYCEKVYLGNWCEVGSIKVSPGTKNEHCPLTENDETLPAQLACAELRIKKLDRLMEFEEEHK